jgi:anaerobic magnesium-protoporphyrin IX monomethyl ester cyclase
MAKVLWVQNLWIEFYGIMTISALLKERGHQSEILFGSVEEIIKTVHSYKPDCIAFSCMTVQWKWAKGIISALKQSGITTPIVVGGIHTTMYPEDAISHPDVDVICLNEGEYPMLEFVQALDDGQDYSTIENLWVRQNGRVIKNPTRPKLVAEKLNALPFADRSLYKKYDHFKNYPFEIFVGSRGCPFKCSFCEVPDINAMYGGKSVYYRDPVEFVDEIEEVKKSGLLDGKLVMFTDSTFNSHRKWFLKFLEEYRRRISTPFSCNLRIDLVDEEQVKALAESGCDNIRFGVESGDPDLRNRILDKHCTDEQIYNVSRLLKKYKIPFITFNLFAIPEETYEQAWKTIRMNQRIKPAGVQSMIFTLFPGIRATENAIEAGLIDRDDLDLLDKYPYNLHLSLLAKNLDRSPDAMRICNLQKFSILAIRLPILEPIIRLLVKLPHQNIFSTIFSVTQAWEYRKWSSKTTFLRLLYEGILNYQALVEAHADEKSFLRKISLLLEGKVKNKIKISENKEIGVLEGNRERMLVEQ